MSDSEDGVADPATMANIAEILGALTIVGGSVFAVVCPIHASDVVATLPSWCSKLRS
jgi:hypothetical protein